MWLSRNITVLDCFSPQNWEVNTCSLWPSYSVFGFTDIQPCLYDKHKWCPHHTRQKNYGLHTTAHILNIAHVNWGTCTYLFWKEAGYLSYQPSLLLWIKIIILKRIDWFMHIWKELQPGMAVYELMKTSHFRIIIICRLWQHLKNIFLNLA